MKEFTTYLLPILVIVVSYLIFSNLKHRKK